MPKERGRLWRVSWRAPPPMSHREALSLCPRRSGGDRRKKRAPVGGAGWRGYYDGTQEQHMRNRSEEHTSELQSLMRISYAVLCLKKTLTQFKHQHNDKANT